MAPQSDEAKRRARRKSNKRYTQNLDNVPETAKTPRVVGCDQCMTTMLELPSAATVSGRGVDEGRQRRVSCTELSKSILLFLYFARCQRFCHSLKCSHSGTFEEGEETQSVL